MILLSYDYAIQLGDNSFIIEYNSDIWSDPQKEESIIKSILSVLMGNELTVRQARWFLQNCINTLDTVKFGGGTPTTND